MNLSRTDSARHSGCDRDTLGITDIKELGSVHSRALAHDVGIVSRGTYAHSLGGSPV